MRLERLVLVVLALFGASVSAEIRTHRKLFVVTAGEQIPGQYIIELSDDADAQPVADMLLQFDGVEIIDRYQGVFNGFSVKGLNDLMIRLLLELEEVLVVAEDGVVGIDGTQNGAPWNLDVLDSSPKDKKYDYEFTGKNVYIYILDTGIYERHADFEGRVLGCRKYERSSRTCNGADSQ